jgi:RNA polymerase sigma factor (sigma-70 family)
MPTRPMSEVVEHVRRAVLLRESAELSDGQLLECFVRDGDGAALAALVRRHASVVWGVCRRLLANHHDVEDAFQATFLVLVRKAASVVPREMVSNWLYGVAHRTALKARARAAKQQLKPLGDVPEPAATEQDSCCDLRFALDRELKRLSDKYRVVIILCDLEGKTRKEVARQLDVPEGTVASRLATARRLLAKRLARRGVGVSGGVLTATLSANLAGAGVPVSTVSHTVEAATLFAARGAISAEMAVLVEGVLKAMFLTKVKITSAVLFLVVLLGAGTAAGVITYRTHAGEASIGAQTTVSGSDTRMSETPMAKGEAQRGSEPPAADGADRIRPGDLLKIQATALPKYPIGGVYQVEASGKVPLGFRWGRVYVKGLTLEEAQAAIQKLLAPVVLSPDVWVTRPVQAPGEDTGRELQTRVERLEKEVRELRKGRAQRASERKPPGAEGDDRIQPGDLLKIQATSLPRDPVQGVYEVEGNGKVALGRSYGRVDLKGLTLEEAEAAIQKFLARVVLNPAVLVTRPVPGEDAGRELETRVERLDKEVRELRSLIEQLKRPGN